MRFRREPETQKSKGDVFLESKGKSIARPYAANVPSRSETATVADAMIRVFRKYFGKSERTVSIFCERWPIVIAL